MNETSYNRLLPRTEIKMNGRACSKHASSRLKQFATAYCLINGCRSKKYPFT